MVRSLQSHGASQYTDYPQDAVPKKRGPKTDVLDALLKRVDGLEAQLRDKNAKLSASPDLSDSKGSERDGEPSPKRLDFKPQAVASEATNHDLIPEAVLNTYFTRYHARPYHLLDEASVRRRIQLGQLPDFLKHAIWAVASRSTPHPNGYHTAARLSDEYAAQSRRELDTDEPSIDGLQAALLLVLAFISAGKGNKAHMMLGMHTHVRHLQIATDASSPVTAVGMAMALEMHRDMDQTAISFEEREARRRLFWSCYLIDRFMACGSKRPSLISDKTIMLRLPAWAPNRSSDLIQGDFFQPNSNLQYSHGSGGKRFQGSMGMLIDIVRILGTTNQYLAAGGVRGDSHFPWHSLSNLSKIRQDLDTWVSGTDGVFSSLDALFGQTDSTVLVLSKLVYHLIYCLIYRPFLPVDIGELVGGGAGGQHESWQIDATNMCFMHANAIAELIELGKQAGTIEWTAFVGYCIFTAGTVHIHGAHYSGQQGRLGSGSLMGVFESSSHFLSREMQYLDELRYTWVSVQHQRDTLQAVYSAHQELVKAMAATTAIGGMRYTPSLHLEDFFERYTNLSSGHVYHFDPAHLSLRDVVVDTSTLPNQQTHTSTRSQPQQIQASGINTTGFVPAPPTGAEHHGDSNHTVVPNSSFSFDDPMFGTLPTNACGTPEATTWHADIAQQGQGRPDNQDVVGDPGSPGNGSSNGSTTNHGEDDKDPFLKLLEQLADDEQRVNNGGSSELDFFITGGMASG